MYVRKIQICFIIRNRLGETGSFSAVRPNRKTGTDRICSRDNRRRLIFFRDVNNACETSYPRSARDSSSPDKSSLTGRRPKRFAAGKTVTSRNTFNFRRIRSELLLESQTRA